MRVSTHGKQSRARLALLLLVTTIASLGIVGVAPQSASAAMYR